MDPKKRRMWIIIIVLVVLVLASIYFASASVQRSVKDVQSNLTGGLDRTVYVYSQSGQLIKTYSGKIDVEYRQDGSIKFSVDGQSIVISNALTVVEENK